jgi:hypothetical protein
MPFKSKAQRRYMYANLPKIAKRWSKHTPKGKKLPEHVKESSMKDAIESKDVSYNLEAKHISFPSKNKAVATYRYNSKKDNVDVFLYFTTGKTFEEVDFSHLTIKDQGDTNPKSNSVSTKPGEEPFQSKALQTFLQNKHYNITSEDIEMAGQDALEKIEDYYSAPAETGESYEESLEFATLADKILNEKES